MTRSMKLLVGVAIFLLAAGHLPAQSIYATLTGVVSDPSGAVIPGATVKLTSEASGSERQTETNSDGYYTFASVTVGDFTYALTIEVKGFQSYKASGIAMSGGEKRNMNVTMTVGSAAQTIEVTGVAESLVPTDSGEKSSTLTTKQLENFMIVSSNAAEFIKITPGFGIANGSSNKANYTGEVIGINANGDGGSQSPLNAAYSYNGLPANSLDITADGAHVSDPGCNCDTPVNPNADMIAEFKVQTTYSAENQKGPMVVSSITKSGGREFHGSGFFSARNYVLNANDALNNASGAPRPQNKYYYPGGTVGGPVLVPGTGFNRNRDKLFFFTGFEYYYQVLDTGLLRATVPDASMLTGNFSPANINATEGAFPNVGGYSGRLPGQITNSAQYPNLLTQFPGGMIPAQNLDPNMVALMKLYPAPNVTPTAGSDFNYVKAATFNQNNRQWMSRVDYSVSDNTKVYVRYNYQRETQQFPVGLWWRSNDQVPYPTPILGKNSSDSVTGSLTHVFSPSMTNEFVFGYTFVGFPNVFSNPAAVDRTKVGFGFAGLFKNGIAQIPSYQGSGEAAQIFNPSGFEAGGPTSGLYADKWMPSVSDVFTKIVSTHTLKAGFFWEGIRNSQPASDNANGNINVNSAPNGNPFTYGNDYADMVTGNLSGYNETNFDRINDISYSTTEGFVQDSWKVTKNLTVDLGVRLSHITPWVDRIGYGFTVFNPAAYSACTPAQLAVATNYCGFEWHKQNSNVPLGGFPTRALFYQPRFGMAWDIFGQGKTVLRGGWGRSYFHSGQGTTGLEVAAGVLTYSLSPSSIGGKQLLLSNLGNVPLSAQAAGVAAVDGSDDKEAYTDAYSFTISQATPASGRLEVGYVGNRSRNIGSSGNGGSAPNGAGSLNLNYIPVGTMNTSFATDPNLLNAANYRAYPQYGTLAIVSNNGYANYNAVQVTWARTRGRYDFSLNYTYGKAMGTNGNYDPFHITNNYGVLPSNRPQIFNAAYSIQLGNPVKGRAAGGLLNGWQVTGITQLESGANLTGIQGQNFGFNSATKVGPTNSYNVSNTSILGTPDVQLNPIVTCDPSKGLGPHQYINPSCYAVPAVGQNGPFEGPVVYGPAYFNSDLALFKSFQISESKKIQFRADGYNFLNHPLWSFNGSNLSLSFDKNGQAPSSFGTVTEKQGHRIIQFAVKFLF